MPAWRSWAGPDRPRPVHRRDGHHGDRRYHPDGRSHHFRDAPAASTPLYPGLMHPYLDAVRERVVDFRRRRRHQPAAAPPRPDDFGGAALEGCNEMLVDTRPDVVADLHRSFLDVGCDVVETNSFGSLPWVLAEYGLAHRTRELAASRPASPGTPWPAPAPAGRSLGGRLARARAPRSPPSARSPSSSSATATRRRPPGCSRAGWTCSSSRPSRTSSRPRRPSSAAGGPWPRPAARSPSRSR